MNPRYIAYAKAQGLTPDAVLELDNERYPGGCMTGFIIWIGQQWRAWAKERPGGMPDIKTDAHHAEFDAWLQNASS